jgi:hypothetical protein
MRKGVKKYKYYLAILICHLIANVFIVVKFATKKNI